MRLHFISIGGSAMHSLALEMKRMGNEITGSDDAIFNPSKAKLKAAEILPETLGWFPEKITNKIDVVILGMHAKINNPELLKAQSLKLKIQSYPEFLAEISQEKTRVVIAGSHGKTTITAMILHVLNYHDISTDFMLGAPVSAVTETLFVSEENDFILLEGDEYLSSAIDLQPKFLWYQPEIALISGIAWDHINVFPTFETYVSQFEKFIFSIREGGVLLYNQEDLVLKDLVENSPHAVKKIPYIAPIHHIENGITFLDTSEGSLPLSVFGEHNLMNLSGAQWISQLMGLDAVEFYEAIPSFTGAAKRLEKISQGLTAVLFKDFAHAPSKVMATAKAVKDQFKGFEIHICLELHTYSSLDISFINQYKKTLSLADKAIIFYDPEALKIKNRSPISTEIIQAAFDHDFLKVITKTSSLEEYLFSQKYDNKIMVMMSSGNFGGLDWDELKALISKY
ncbi:Mur ligase family protein [Flavobacteriaceae bacterium]|nr:Mur ligase family protein [Flavobacteriaceae bacterium]MDB4062726.1 Mur ligase family protein [Flavobacteriaceae bacterium]MDB4235292.1 Mur ligase family protein [bacterium]MDB4255159.1 Mur ligase family protein [Flavobacteriaceae bacterium]MDC1391857.1 Mur ligase family protein [Flavobacteriaceae bacterium]